MICNSSVVLRVIYYIKIVITIIKIFVPILLIVTMMIDGLRSMSGSDVDMPSLFNAYKTKLIAALLIFFIPTFVNFTASISNNDKSYLSCIKNATKEKINEKVVEEVNSYINIALKSGNKSDLLIATQKVNEIKDEKLKDELLSKLSVAELNINLKEEVEKYVKGNYDEKKYNELLGKINSLDDKNLKDKLLSTLEKHKTDSQSNSETQTADFRHPTAPVGQRVNSVGNALSGLNICTMLESKGSSCNELNAKIKSSVQKAGVGTRAASVAAATTLIDTLSNYGYKINYEWWGKYAKIGVDTKWGDVLSDARYNRDCNDYGRIYPETIDNCWNNMQWYGLDCSGFVQWVMIQAMQDTKVEYNLGKEKYFSSDKNYAQCSIGDPIFAPGHVAIIVGIDNANKSYKIAESSSGVTYNTIPFTGGRFTHCKIYPNYKDSPKTGSSSGNTPSRNHQNRIEQEY